MSKISKNENGFSAIEIVLIIAVLVLIGLVGWLVYKDHHKTTPVAQSSSAYSGWKTYTSNLGFSFKYPSGWTVKTDSDLGTAAGLQLVENGTGVNDFNLTFSINKPTTTTSIESSTSNLQTLSNGLRVSTYNGNWSSTAYKNNQQFVCANMSLLAKKNGSGIVLTNSDYITSYGSFCNVQDSYTTLTPTQQAASPEWEDALNVYSSLKFQ